MDVKNNIPAYSMWKMFNDTIPELSKIGYSENSVKHLTNIINSKEFSNIFVYNHNPSLTFEQYEFISNKYKSFTVWILGIFFYWLSCEKLSRFHELIIDAQVRILNLLSITQPHIYIELTNEYCKALDKTVSYLKTQNKITLDVFIPEKQQDLDLDLNQTFVEINSYDIWYKFILKVINIIKQILCNHMELHLFNNVINSFDSFFYLIENCNIELKLIVTDVYVELLNLCYTKNDNLPIDFINKMDLFYIHFERLVFYISDEQNEIPIKLHNQLEKVLTCLNKNIKINKICNKLPQYANFSKVFQSDYKTSIKDLLQNGVFNDEMLNKFPYFEQQIILEIKSYCTINFEQIIDVSKASKTYLEIYTVFDKLLKSSELNSIHKYLKHLQHIKFIINNSKQLIFFKQEEIINLLKIVDSLKPNNNNNVNDYLKLIVDLLSLSVVDSTSIFYYYLLIYFPQSESIKYLKYENVKPWIGKLFRLENTSDSVLVEVLEHLGKLLASDLVVENWSDGNLEMAFQKLLVKRVDVADEQLSVKLTNICLYSVICFKSYEWFIRNILFLLLESQNNHVLKTIASILPSIVCVLCSKHVKLIKWELKNCDFNISINCDDCQMINIDNDELDDVVIKKCNKKCDSKLIVNQIFKNSLKLFNSKSPEVLMNAIAFLPSLSKHVPNFNSTNMVQMWMDLAENENKEVRLSFVENFHKTLLFIVENKSSSKQFKEESIQLFYNTFKKFTKKSMRDSNFDLQDTLLKSIRKICSIDYDKLPIFVMQLLLYFIMIPTSMYSMIAVNTFLEMGAKRNCQMKNLYAKYKQELCHDIAELCAINYILVEYGLSTSLEKISIVLGFVNTKDFVSQESHHLLPHFVTLAAKMPEVAILIDEMSNLLEFNLKDLLASKYGNIFFQVFLYESQDVFKKSMLYLENKTGMSGPVLRKNNFKVILNELLLNFYEKSERVELALKLLAQEDGVNDTSTNQLRDYLQPKFLGVLQYFDTKLISKNLKKEKVLLSLIKIFHFMGPKGISPFRFKIIAMLQTALNLNYGSFPELNCDVWDAFIRCCDIESLAPQLATIFISIMVLFKNFPGKINSIFRYLVMDNENYTREYIPDLFFTIDMEIDLELRQVIKKHLNVFENKPFKQQLKVFLKHLNHESVDIRVYALKYVKKLLENNREQLDRMILGYNGMDQAIVELLDLLTIGCRTKENTLKLACAEVLGELGAVEPSHLPRRYAQEDSSFTFFINEDNFLLNILNELAKALLAEKNTQNIDRYAVAIQGMLKTYEISPDQNKTKSYLWTQFSDAHQELMLPFLSSRYVCVQSLEANYNVPIYSSKQGTSFKSWIYNWTCSLIISLSHEKRNLLQMCLPSMKQDTRILMNFLPHILLHSLLEGGSATQQKAYTEISFVVNSFNDTSKLDDNVANLRPVRTPTLTLTSLPATPEDVKQNNCTKIIFVLLDFLNRWMREWLWTNGLAGRNNENYQTIQNFLSRFCKLQLARCNYLCGEYPRALLYLEDFISDNNNQISEHLSFLAEIYAQLDDPDAIAGVTALQQTEPTLEHRILALEVSGKLTEAASCYERIPPPLKLHHVQGLVQCYMDLDNMNTALNFARGTLDLYSLYGNVSWEMQAEPLWRLGRYDELDSLLEKNELKNSNSWGVQIGRALLYFRSGKRDDFKNVLNALRMQQVDLLGATSLEESVYQHGYSYISKLHALNELEQVEYVTYELLLRANDHNATEAIMSKLISEWKLRMKVVQESVKITEPILCLRRVAIEQARKLVQNKVPHALSSLDSIIGESWLNSAKTARHAGLHQQAYTYTLKAEEYSPQGLFLEKAKLHWLREEQEHALAILRRAVEILLPENTSPVINTLSVEQRKMCAEAKLLIATYNDLTSYVDSDVNVQHYKEAVEVFKEWEKSLVFLGQYYDKIFQSYSPEERDTKGSEMQIHMMNYFGKSLQYGTEYVYQSLPRLLGIWFDYGTRLLDVTLSTIKVERKSYLLKMTKLVDTYLERLPSYIFLTAFSQLVSRICHPQKEVCIELKTIIVKLILNYPQHCLWMIISVIKSSYQARSNRCTEILSDSRLKTPAMATLIKDFTKLAEQLILLCNKEIPDNVTTASVNVLLRTLPRILTKGDFSEIMIPTHKFRKLVLPNPDFKSSQHNPFPNHYVHIIGIEDEISVLHSLQRPRKITFRGSDGKSYIQMLKPKDDLRKDFRLMEFNDIVNQLLSREADSRQRRLNIRLYSVVPLNEECGLIEWIPNMVGLRPILVTLYKQLGLGMANRELKEMCGNIRDPLAKKRENFTKHLLPRHPPILGEWFRKTFPDAQSWLTARTAYTRTTAVMSMVGYILGLGDRHGENILLDSICGDVMHVDFNCLFNKGETFEWPERVPFRLTQNMVAAMGPLGVEGVFRKSCACTLRVLRTYTNTLMSIVTPFVYDPLVSWHRLGQNKSNSEKTNEQAVEHIRNIELRLQGIMKNRSRNLSIPLSVEGQTNNLITEAINVDNLCQMYIGWGPYL